MAKIQETQPLIASVLDRLLDDDPTVSREVAKSRNVVLRELKQAVRRDLENLLNHRRRVQGWPAGLGELDKSLVGFGLPDFTGTPMTTPESREQLRRTLENVIRTFEPRFKTVRVHVLDTAEPRARTLRFRIDALLHADPAPEPVVFDSALEPATGTVRVKGGGS
jgi:type VI secretion system protein ImpF